MMKRQNWLDQIRGVFGGIQTKQNGKRIKKAVKKVNLKLISDQNCVENLRKRGLYMEPKTITKTFITVHYSYNGVPQECNVVFSGCQQNFRSQEYIKAIVKEEGNYIHSISTSIGTSKI